MEVPDFAAGLGVWPYFPGLPVPEISVDEETALIRHLEQQSLFQKALERMDNCEHEKNMLNFSDILLD
ncbi:hypothetical protein TH5_08635 [Thalassospira xianhensis MCCC 1A02616]|nr:hypothetical protein TH5_08635 [Thalassospira xianhensis MCCC 1A02616]